MRNKLLSVCGTATLRGTAPARLRAIRGSVPPRRPRSSALTSQTRERPCKPWCMLCAAGVTPTAYLASIFGRSLSRGAAARSLPRSETFCPASVAPQVLPHAVRAGGALPHQQGGEGPRQALLHMVRCFRSARLLFRGRPLSWRLSAACVSAAVERLWLFSPRARGLHIGMMHSTSPRRCPLRTSTSKRPLSCSTSERQSTRRLSQPAARRPTVRPPRCPQQHTARAKICHEL